MQYWQRRLHRSVTDRRRLRRGRLKRSRVSIRIQRTRSAAASKAGRALPHVHDRQATKSARDESMHRRLAVEPAAPAAGDRQVARWAAPLARDPVGADAIALAFDQTMAAAGAGGIFEIPDRAGEV